MKIKLYFLVLVVAFFISCGHNSTSSKENNEKNVLSLAYAKGFKVQYFHHYKKVTVINPWKNNENLATYYLISNDTTPTPNNGNRIVVPITKLASSSVTHLEFLQLLGKIEALKGFCNPQLAYNKNVRKNAKNNRIIDLGDSFSIDVEKTIVLRPQIIMMSAYHQKSQKMKRLEQIGIPIIYNNEWLENHILGRAEWIKFVALFFNEEKKADSIFRATVKNYNKFKKIAQQAKEQPTVMSGSNFRGIWYMPAGKSYMSQLFRDARAHYFYHNDTTKGSLPLNIETVLKNFSKADFWLNTNFNSYKELLLADEKHQLFKAVKKQNIYNFNNRSLPCGANDYWESAIAHPDLLLGDFIAILHPTLLPKWKFYYAKKLTP